MLGDFGPEVVTFASIEAVGNEVVLGDSIFGNGVQIVAHLSENSNLAGIEPVGTVLSPTQISVFLSFSDFLGLAYSATFTDRKTLVITVIDSSGGLASIGEFFMTAKPDAVTSAACSVVRCAMPGSSDEACFGWTRGTDCATSQPRQHRAQ